MPTLPTNGESTPTATCTGMLTADTTPATSAAVNDDDDDEVVFVSSQNRADRKCAIIIDLDAMPDIPDTEKDTPTKTPSRNNTSRTTSSTTTTASNRKRHRTQRQLFSDNNDTVYHKRITREVEQRRCRICKTELTFFNVFVGADCRHSFCHDCTLSYLMGMTQVPIICLHDGCNRELHSHAVLNVLETAAAVTDEHRRKREMLQQLYVKHDSISMLAYCANSECATPFDFEPGSSTQDPQANKIRCPLCMTDTCGRCGVRWHEGMTCEAFGEQLRRQREREAAERAAQEGEKGGDEEGETEEESKKNGIVGEEQTKDGDQDNDGNQGVDSKSKEGLLQEDSPQDQKGSGSGSGGGKGTVD